MLLLTVAIAVTVALLAMIAPAKALADLDQLGLDEQTRQQFLTGNAVRVVGLRYPT